MKKGADVVGMEKKHLGELGENLACEFLRKKGYQILERNFRCRMGEIDIIARRSGTLVFCEVKTRRSLKYGLPCQAVNRKKMEHLRKAATFYTLLKGSDFSNLRMDVVEVLKKDGRSYIRHIENAF